MGHAGEEDGVLDLEEGAEEGGEGGDGVGGHGGGGCLDGVRVRVGVGLEWIMRAVLMIEALVGNYGGRGKYINYLLDAQAQGYFTRGGIPYRLRGAEACGLVGFHSESHSTASSMFRGRDDRGYRLLLGIDGSWRV